MSRVVVREYKKDDFEMITSWWRDAEEQGPTPDMMVEGSSFVAELDKIPVLAVTVYLTNGPVVWVDNFIGNPNVGKDRKLAAQLLSNHIANFSKDLGYEGMLCMTEKNVLAKRYEELGYKPTMKGVTTLVRRI